MICLLIVNLIKLGVHIYIFQAAEEESTLSINNTNFILTTALVAIHVIIIYTSVSRRKTKKVNSGAQMDKNYVEFTTLRSVMTGIMISLLTFGCNVIIPTKELMQVTKFRLP